MKKKNSFAAPLVVALMLLAVGAYSAPASAAAAAAASSSSTTESACTPQTIPFSVTGATWGTPGSSLSVYPGDQNAPLTISMLFSGPCSSPQTTFILSLAQSSNPVPFTGPNGMTQPKDVSLNISPNTIVTETFYLNVDQNAATGIIYNIPLIIQYANNTVSDIVTQITTAPIALYGPVQLNFAAETTHLLAGAVNNVTILISNSGSAASGTVSMTVTAPSSVTVLNQLSATTALPPGGSTTRVLELFTPTSLSGSAFTLTFTAKYLDAYSNSQTTTQTVGFMVATPTVEPGSSFIAVGAQWGSSASATSPFPGTQNTPLVVSLQYLGSTPVTSLQGTVHLPAGVTDLNGHSAAVAYSSATTNQYGAVQLTFYLNIASSVVPGSYNFTLDLSWMTSQSLGLSQTVVLTPPPISALQSVFQVQGSAWGSSPTAAAPVPGTLNAPLVVTLQYIGTTSVTSLKGTLTLPAGVTDLNGRQTATAFAATVSPNQVITLTFPVDVGSNVKPGSYNYTLDLSWTTSVSTTLAQSSTVSPPPVAAPTTTESFPLSISQQNSTVVAGSQTGAGFQLTNEGTTPIYSPTFALTVASPLVLASIGSPAPTAELDPGKATTFVAHLTSGPSAAAGVYSGTLTVTFTDSNGASHTQSFPVSFALEGTVILVLQNTAVTQTTTAFTVTGSILNEGSVPAYYASITGLLGIDVASPVYLGEIDPNTPLPFSVTIPFPAPTTSNAAAATTTASATTRTETSATGVTTTTSAGTRTFTFGSRTITGGAGNFRNGSFPGGVPGLANGTRAAAGSANIAITLNYKDTFSRNQAQAFTVPTTVRTASELSAGQTVLRASSSGPSELTYIAYGVVAALVLTLVVGAFMVRRQRAKRMASIPADQRGEQAVI